MCDPASRPAPKSEGLLRPFNYIASASDRPRMTRRMDVMQDRSTTALRDEIAIASTPRLRHLSWMRWTGGIRIGTIAFAFASIGLVGCAINQNDTLPIFFDGSRIVWGTPAYEQRNIAVSQIDLDVLIRARAALPDQNRWERVSQRSCEPASSRSLFCALQSAQKEITGTYDHRLPAMQEVRFVIDDQFPKRWTAHRLMDFNSHPQTTFEDVLFVLDTAILTVKSKLLAM